MVPAKRMMADIGALARRANAPAPCLARSVRQNEWMSDGPEQDSSGNPRYTYKPSLFGAGCEFELSPDALHWRIGGGSGRIPYGAIRRVRMSFRPAAMQNQRFVTEIRAEGSPKIQIVSTPW